MTHTDAYLEVTFRHGQPFAAYLHLHRQPRQRPTKQRRVEPGMVVDLAADGTAVGIELTAPSQVSLPVLNKLLKELGLAPMQRIDLAPLTAA